ncbi:MAG: hypothetical protein J0L56_16545 [Chitinophagales bacterium]|nr:hypothetical protein [Chitinophagales bacterium]
MISSREKPTRNYYIYFLISETMKTLLTLVHELETKLPFIEQRKETVSQATVGWHLEHSLLALVKMISATEHSNPADYRWKFNLKRSVVLLLGKIPRGKAKAPSTVKPGETISTGTIIPLLEKAKQKVELFEKLGSDKFFTHPVFGDVKLKQARRVIAIHTAHHLAIINDILGG